MQRMIQRIFRKGDNAAPKAHAGLSLISQPVHSKPVIMEKVGWVARAEDRRDARVSCVVLRKSGRRLAREGLRTLAAQSEALFGETWSTEDVRTLAGLLGRLTAQLPGKLQA